MPIRGVRILCFAFSQSLRIQASGKQRESRSSGVGTTLAVRRPDRGAASVTNLIRVYREELLNLELTPTASDVVWKGPRIDTWGRFHRIVKQPGRRLLAALPRFTDCVLVAGCQRSGTTALTRTLRCGKGMADFRFCEDDELAGALLLAGHVESPVIGRYCFQTTYLNDRFAEYFDTDNFRLVWVIREPAAVVHSMLHDWNRGALRRLFDSCGKIYLGDVEDWRPRLFSYASPTSLEMACASYIAKATQTFRLAERLGNRLLIVDYDELVGCKQSLLPEIFSFAGIEPDPAAMGLLHSRSVGHGSQFPIRVANRIHASCGPLFERLRERRTIGASHVW